MCTYNGRWVQEGVPTYWGKQEDIDNIKESATFNAFGVRNANSGASEVDIGWSSETECRVVVKTTVR